MNIKIRKQSGKLEDFNAEMINRAISHAAQGLKDSAQKTAQIATETSLTLYNGMTTTEIDQAVISATVQNIKDDPDFDIIASRLMLKLIYKEVLGDFKDDEDLLKKYRSDFPLYVKNGIEEKLLSEKLNIFDLEELAKNLKPENDALLNYTGISTLKHRYLIKGANQKLRETPQYFFMRLAMAMAENEKEATKMALEFYQKMSALEYIPGGSTNINAGTPSPRLSNCFLMSVDDSIDHIAKTVADVMKLSKATGGIGLAVTRLRASGSPINTNNTFSSGPIPFLHIIDSTIRAISRAGKKMGALCFYMENWHLDFQDFLDLKQNAGDDYRRARTANIAAWISDEFMMRVKTDEYWYLFDPKETPDLPDLYGEEFSRRYNEYVELAEAGKMRIFKKMKAKEQFNNMIVSLQGTSHPWLTWKDAINVRALNNNTGTIMSSNLCTEITLPADKDRVAVCNLLSINLSRHLTEDKKIDFEKLKTSVQLGVLQLDNLIDVNEPPIPEANTSDKQSRAIGLGVMGLADLFEKLGFSYDNPGATELADELLEFISYHAIEMSADLAKEKGSYPDFKGSAWSKGLVPFDTLEKLENLREKKGENLSKFNKDFKLDWDKLRKKVKQGMRNSTLMAIAPTANIGLVAGTSTGIDPRFAQIFSRNTLSGKYLELNKNLVDDLKDLGIWEKTREKILGSKGDLTEIEEIPDNLKAIYKDSFSVKPQAFIDVASRAQKWIDQAISRNMYLATRDTEEIMNIYLYAWETGLKTTYYLHMKPRHSAEQSTIKVNKTETMGRKGFGALIASRAQSPACPLDPQERLQCDSCQ